VDWEALKDRDPLPTPAPKAPEQTPPPEQEKIPPAPERASPRYQPSLGLLDKLIKSWRREKEAWKARLFESDMREWETARDRILGEHAAKLEAHNKREADLEAAYASATAKWKAERKAHGCRQAIVVPGFQTSE